MENNNKPTIAIVGASFAGLSAVLKLRRRLGDSIDIKLFDGRDHFCYIPGLHEGINKPSFIPSLLFPIKKYYPEFIHEKVVTVSEHSLTTESGETHNFDFCIIATGSRTNFYNNKQREENGYAMRYCEDLFAVNERLQQQETKNITVIGGGYTGVEVASTIAQRKRPDQHVRIIHSGPRLFHRLGESISKKSIKRLKRNNVEVVIDQRVATIDKTTLTTEDGTVFNSDLTIVSAGIVTNSELIKPDRTFNKEYHSEENNHIFLCGDVAAHGLYTTAHNAIMEGRRVGDMIANSIKGINVEYSPLVNRDKLAIALGTKDGILTDGKHGIYIPRLTGFTKRVIQYRVLIEFKYKIMFWV